MTVLRADGVLSTPNSRVTHEGTEKQTTRCKKRARATQHAAWPSQLIIVQHTDVRRTQTMRQGLERLLQLPFS